MSQQTDALLGKYGEEFEDRNAGVAGPEPEEAGPGVLGKLLTSFQNVKERVSGRGSTPTTPSGVQTQQQHESRVEGEVEGVPHERSTPTTPSGIQTQQQHESRVEGEAEGVPHEQSAPDLVHNDAVGSGGRVGDAVEPSPVGGLSSGRSSRSVEAPASSPRGVGGEVEGVPHEQSAPDQVHNDAVGAGGRVGDGVGASRVGGLSSGGSSRSVEAPASSPGGDGHNYLRDGASPASPKLPRKDLGERIIDKLPGSHANPYSVGQTDSPRTTNPYTAGGDRSALPTSPSAQQSTSAPLSPSLMGKVKNMFTGQKPSRGTATENATTGTAGTTGAQQPVTHGYTQDPTPDRIGDIFLQAKEKFGHKGPDAGSAETWPSPSKPDISSIPSATRTNAEGQPIEGPTQPKSEDTKKEGLMTKLMDKLHIHEKSSSPRASSPRATTADKGTPTATTGTPNTNTRPQETGIPAPTEGAPETTMGTASGPTEN